MVICQRLMVNCQQANIQSMSNQTLRFNKAFFPLLLFLICNMLIRQDNVRYVCIVADIWTIHSSLQKFLSMVGVCMTIYIRNIVNFPLFQPIEQWMNGVLLKILLCNTQFNGNENTKIWIIINSCSYYDMYLFSYLLNKWFLKNKMRIHCFRYRQRDKRD